MQPNNQWIAEEIKEESKIYLETNENMMIQNQWDIAIAILRGTFIQYYPTSRIKKNIE